MKSKNKNKKAFTVVELITAVAIIAILLGVLMPALNMVRKTANNAKQTAQIASIGIAVNMFKNDDGDYPPSRGCNFSGVSCNSDNPDYGYCGAQTLTEAVIGQDLLGVHSDTIYRRNGEDKNNDYLYIDDSSSQDDIDDSLNERKGPYLDRSNIGVFEAEDVFGDNFVSILEPERYVICDSFTNFKRTIDGVKYKVGTPVLYFKANTGSQNINSSTNVVDRIYNVRDNERLIMQRKIEQNAVSDREYHEGLMDSGGDPAEFYERITDTFISSPTRPVNPDSFLLISAGADGFYGTADDICNFTPNFQQP